MVLMQVWIIIAIKYVMPADAIPKGHIELDEPVYEPLSIWVTMTPLQAKIHVKGEKCG